MTGMSTSLRQPRTQKRNRDLQKPGHPTHFATTLPSDPDLELTVADVDGYFEPDLRDVEADVAAMVEEYGPDYTENLDLDLDAPFIPEDATPPF